MAAICCAPTSPPTIRLYLHLVEIEQVFKELKSDLAIRPIHQQVENRIEAHIFVAFLAYIHPQRFQRSTGAKPAKSG